MRKYAFIILFFTLAAGAVGFYSRNYELRTAFEPLTGLAIRGAPASAWLSFLTVIFIIVIAAFSVFTSLRYKSPEGFKDAFGSGTVFYPLAFVIMGIVWILGTVIYVTNLWQAYMLQTSDIYFAVLSILAALSAATFSIEMYRNPDRKSAYILSIVPIVFLCYWLILMYSQNAANPVLISYVYHCFAIATAALSFYFTAGFLYGKPAPELAVITYSSTIYFCNVAQADNLGTGISLIISALYAFGAIHLFMLLYHMVRKEETERAGFRRKKAKEDNDAAEGAGANAGAEANDGIYSTADVAASAAKENTDDIDS